MRCDGLVASTPVGSTGYNLANQGPILAWGVKGYVVSYISPHSLTARALVVAPGDVLHVENAAGREPVDVAVDGEQTGALEPGAELASASPTTSAASPSSPGRASTSASARSSATSPSDGAPPGRRDRLIRLFAPWSANGGPCVLISIATFMLLLDITVVNVALPDIQRELGASLSSLQWVVDAYTLTLAAFLLTAGSLGDRLGRRRVFSIGFGIFTFASFLCGISGDPTLLNLARGLQGVGAAGMFATSLALIGQEFHGKDRATAFGVWGATVGGAVAIGPLVGGLITEHLGWEWIFFVNVPIGVAAIALTETADRQRRRRGRPSRIDFPGLVTFSLGLFLLIFGLIRGNPEGWGSTPILASLIGAVVAAARSSSRSRRAARTRCSTSSLFRKPAFNGVSAVAFCLSAGMFAMFLYLTLYIQGVLGYEPLEAGLRFLPMTVLSFVVSPIAGALSHRIPIRVLLGVGLAFVGVGLLLIHGVDGRLDLDRAARRVPARPAIGIGITNPGIGQAAIARRAGREIGDGLGDQHHLPPGRDLDRGRRARRGLPVADRLEARRAASRRPHGLGELVASGGSRAAALAAPAGRKRPPTCTPPKRLRLRLQRDRPDRGDRLLRRRARSASPWSARATSCSRPAAPSAAPERAWPLSRSR